MAPGALSIAVAPRELGTLTADALDLYAELVADARAAYEAVRGARTDEERASLVYLCTVTLSYVETSERLRRGAT